MKPHVPVTHRVGGCHSEQLPHLVRGRFVIALHTLGDDYLVWDQAAEIEYLKPGRGVVSAEFRLEAAELERLRHDAAGGAKLLPEFRVEIHDAAGELVARVRKRIYVRLKLRARPAPA